MRKLTQMKSLALFIYSAGDEKFDLFIQYFHLKIVNKHIYQHTFQWAQLISQKDEKCVN